ncbi:hypothetical protein P389DRAFT_169009 [Cystobasidium minutum MCA 4210]|uniref:uncharacterized protein n=1 Tax=Cystobasidium minutum MCA 4210 TaxID=1397322 RepID=UPI0034CE77EB|eukprot:jgi/Rhomi1/169009/fgenesh1_kg.3_\
MEGERAAERVPAEHREPTTNDRPGSIFETLGRPIKRLPQCIPQSQRQSVDRVDGSGPSSPQDTQPPSNHASSIAQPPSNHISSIADLSNSDSHRQVPQSTILPSISLTPQIDKACVSNESSGIPSVTAASANANMHTYDTFHKRKAVDEDDTGTPSIESDRFAAGSKFKSFKAFEAVFEKWHTQKYPQQKIWTRTENHNAACPHKVCSNEGRDDDGNKVCKFVIKLRFRENNTTKMIVTQSHLAHSEACLHKMAHRDAKRLKTADPHERQSLSSINKASPSLSRERPSVEFLQPGQMVASREEFENQLLEWHEKAFPGKPLHTGHYHSIRGVKPRYFCNQLGCPFRVILDPLDSAAGYRVHLSESSHAKACSPCPRGDNTTPQGRAAAFRERSKSSFERLSNKGNDQDREADVGQGSKCSAKIVSGVDTAHCLPQSHRIAVDAATEAAVLDTSSNKNAVAGIDKNPDEALREEARNAPYPGKQYRSFKKLGKSIKSWHGRAFVGGDGLCIRRGAKDRTGYRPLITCRDYELKKTKCRFRINFKSLGPDGGYVVTTLHAVHTPECRAKPVDKPDQTLASSSSHSEEGIQQGRPGQAEASAIASKAVAANTKSTYSSVPGHQQGQPLSFRAMRIPEITVERFALHGIKTPQDLDEVVSGWSEQPELLVKVINFVSRNDPFEPGNKLCVAAYVTQLLLTAMSTDKT